MHLLNNDSAKDRLRGVGAVNGSGLSPLSANRRLLTSATAPINDHLDALEAQSIYIFREAFARLKKLALLWSLGKDSNVMIWLARKAFFGRVPFPALHVDTGKKFPETVSPPISSVRPENVALTVSRWVQNMPLNTWFLSRISWYIG